MCALIAGMAGACALPVSIPLAPLTNYASSDVGTQIITGSIEPAIEDAGVAARIGGDVWPGLRPALARAVTRGDDGETFAWHSPDNGYTGTVTSVSAYFNGDGGTCRRLAVTAAQGRVSDVFLAEACRDERGGWRVTPA